MIIGSSNKKVHHNDTENLFMEINEKRHFYKDGKVLKGAEMLT